jgi:hypothetical protein
MAVIITFPVTEAMFITPVFESYTVDVTSLLPMRITTLLMAYPVLGVSVR